MMKREELFADRYEWLRERIGKTVFMRDKGVLEIAIVEELATPDPAAVDAAIDAAMAREARYTITEAGRAMLRDAQQGVE